MSAPQGQTEFTTRRIMHVVLWAIFLYVVFWAFGLGIASIMQYSGMGMVAASSVANASGMTLAAAVGAKLGLSNIVMASELPYMLGVAGAGLGAAIGYLNHKE